MNTDMIDSGAGNGTEAGLGRLASLKWWGTVIAVVGGVVSMLAVLGGILWHLAMAQAERTVAQAERANISETLASIKRTVEENRAGIAKNRAAILVNTAELRAIRTTVEANSADIKANSVDIAENRATIALILKTSEENRNLLVLARGDIMSLKLIQEEFGQQQRLLQANQLEFSGKLEEFGSMLTAVAETHARDTAETRAISAEKIGDVEALAVDLDGRVERIEDLIFSSHDAAAAPSSGA